MRRYTTNITSDELKTIAVTSAIAAAGTAMATALVTYALDRWVLKSESEEGPMFVVVPVVEREVPPEVVVPPNEPPTPPAEPPLIAGFGKLSAQQRAQAQQMLPWRYWEEFYQCWNDEDPAYRSHCDQLTQMYESLDDEGQDELDDIVSEVPNVSKTEVAGGTLLVAGTGVAVGMLIAMAIAG
jgi:hypothetical protein